MRDPELFIDENVPIPMRDGVNLSARIWKPATALDERLPAIIEAIPYRKSDGTVQRDATTHGVMSRAGYVCIRVDLRGTGTSGGYFDDEYSEQELQDIEDVVAWASAAPWSSGAVGIMGISWGGINALMTAARQPPGLKAVISAASVIDRYADDIHYKGGCQLVANFSWASQAMSILSLPPDPDTANGDWLQVWLDRLDKTTFLPSLWINGEGKTDYWTKRSIADNGQAIKVPVLAIAGHKDGYRNLPIKLLEFAGAESKALLGPWDHNYPNISSFGPWLDFADLAVRWWDRWLKEIPNGVDREPALRSYILDGEADNGDNAYLPGFWVATDTWPSTSVGARQLHLTDNGLNDTPGALSKSVEPNLLCGTAAGDFFSRTGEQALHPAEQSPDDLNALCFDSDPFLEECVLLGEARLDLRLSCSEDAGQIVARICDVAPDGRSRMIALGMMNLGFREGFERPVSLVPGQVYDVGIVFDHAGYRIAPGHVLRLAISTSYWPFIWPEASAASLQLLEGSLTLPVFGGGRDVEFGDFCRPPEVPAVTQQLAPPTLRQEWTCEGGRRRRTRQIDMGTAAMLHNAVTRSGTLRETASIDPVDPCSARIEVEWHGALSRGDFDTETRLTTRMMADKHAFYTWGRLQALNNGYVIFDRDFHDMVLRHGAPARSKKTTNETSDHRGENNG